jgi:DNA-binding MurR/RpiR family transcriptional regulator
MVRLAHHLGFSGFSDFQSVFRDRLKVRASTYEERLARLERGAEAPSLEMAVLTGFLEAARQSVESLQARLEPAAFAKAVAMLAKAETIHIVAKRRAYPLAAHLSYAFAKLGVRAQLHDSSNGIDEEGVGFARPGDAAIVASFSPYAPASLDLARSLAAQGVPIIAITDSAMSPLAAIAAQWLEVAEADHAGFRSLSAAIALAGALSVAVAEHRRQKH